jgi:hypothetical protein
VSTHRVRSLLPLAGLCVLCVLSVFFLGACGRKIGDDCKTGLDCSQEADRERTCDVSQPGGYCTVEGCDERSCPDDAVCIRFFPRLFLGAACTRAEDCSPEELCLPEGKCAPRASERRYCAAPCDDDGDCRSRYECRLAGTKGSIALVKNPESRVRFCAPAGR